MWLSPDVKEVEAAMLRCLEHFVLYLTVAEGDIDVGLLVPLPPLPEPAPPDLPSPVLVTSATVIVTVNAFVTVTVNGCEQMVLGPAPKELLPDSGIGIPLLRNSVTGLLSLVTCVKGFPSLLASVLGIFSLPESVEASFRPPTPVLGVGSSTNLVEGVSPPFPLMIGLALVLDIWIKLLPMLFFPAVSVVFGGCLVPGFVHLEVFR